VEISDWTVRDGWEAADPYYESALELEALD
jgi:hypothetical protein